jgi:hypothetical protein
MKILAAATILAGLALSSGWAQAMPVAPAANTDAGVIQVAGGCGPGMHRGPYGGCRMNRGRVVVVPPRAYVPRVVRRCPPGMMMRYGRCR